MIENKIEISSYKHNSNCFDFLRLLFSFSVLIGHFGILSQNKFSFFISPPMAVGGFFVISGFLISKSFISSQKVSDYLIKRAKRILPAYLAVVLICAVCLVAVSSFRFNEYFFSQHFFKYLFSNIGFLNFLEPTLPGVFDKNYFNAVNGSLWTIKIEIAFYLLTPFIIFISQKNKFYWSCFMIYLISFVFFIIMNKLYSDTGKNIYEILSRQFLGQFRFFISGVFLFYSFDFLKKNLKFLFPAALLIVIISRIFDVLLLQFLYPISFAVVIIGFAYNFRWLNNFGKFGDISYGMYLWHFPIIQLFISLNIFKKSPLSLFIVCLFSITVISFLSWHLLEKRFLVKKLKRNYHD